LQAGRAMALEPRRMGRSETFLIRRAVAADAAVLGAMRAASHGERYDADPERGSQFAASCTTFFERELAAAQPFVRAWLAFEPSGAEPLGTATLTLVPTLPRQSDAGPLLGARVRNVYVVPAARRRGIARALMRVLMDEIATLGIGRLTLGASAEGRPLYAGLGFVAKADEMVLGD
jgi:GNAT superfamily N-acetyltransferase